MTPSDPSSSTIPILKSFALTHILYDPHDRTSTPLALLSLSPIFLFVAYFTLIIFTRRLTILGLAAGSVGNEVLSLALKRAWKGERPYKDILGEVGEGYGMPSSHSQAAGFLVAWGVGYWLAQGKREERSGSRVQASVVRSAVRGVYVFGLVLWSLMVAYSRYVGTHLAHICSCISCITCYCRVFAYESTDHASWHLRYHSPIQVVAGYTIGLAAGGAYFVLTEYIPIVYPTSILGRMRSGVEWMWMGVGGVSGHELGDAAGGWGEGHFFGHDENIDRKRQ
jgi:dolichyldiphosphatase